MRVRSGAVLIEAVVALALLGAGVITVLGLSSAAARGVEWARLADERLATAENLLGAVSLWPREDLDRRLGRRPEGRWFLRIDRESSTIYEITILDSGGAAFLATSVFRRPER